MNVKFFAVAGFLLCSGATAAHADKAEALLTGTTSSVVVEGTVMLEDTTEGLKVHVDFLQAPPGKHAFHIHEFGSCKEEGKAAGSHYNPKDHPHGQVLKDGIQKSHPGDFGNLVIDQRGRGTLKATVPGLALTKGDYTVAGRAFVLHEKQDDFSQPVGNAGGRIGCGPIVLTGK